MASKDVVMFSQQDLMTSSFSILYDMKQKGELNDITIRIEGRSLSAHRVILAAAIPYFRAMFHSNLAESCQKKVTMKELDPAALESLIDFAYTGKVKITSQNVHSLLVASDFLQLSRVRDTCCNFLSEKLDPNTVMKVRALADRLNCMSLVANADKYIKENFDAFCQTKEFLGLSFSSVNDLIKRDDLHVSSEEKVFDAVMTWVKAESKRHTMLKDLLTGIRMTFLTPQFLIKKASKEKLIMDSVPCRNLLDEAKHYHLLPEEGASGCSFVVSERSYGEQKGSGIYLFCCNKVSGLTVFKYMPTSKKWNNLLNDKSRGDLKHVLAVGDEIYAFRRNSFEIFNTRTLAWTPRSFFQSTSANFKHIVTFDKKLYWFGSQNASQGIYFDKQQNQWFGYNHGNLSIYSDDEIVLYRDTVCIFGSTSRFQNTRQRNIGYCFRTQCVFDFPKMPDDRKAFGSAVYGNSLYVCGGIQKYCLDFEEEDADCGRRVAKFTSSLGWEMEPPMNAPRNNFSLLSYEKKLYAIGGTTGADNNIVEIYDPSSRKWDVGGGSLNVQYDFMKAVAIEP